MSSRVKIVMLATTIVAAILASHAYALGTCGSCKVSTCAEACTSCQPAAQCVTCEKTIMVPTMVKEKRKVQKTKCVPEKRTRTVTQYKRVAETKEVECNYTVMVPKKCTKTVKYTVCVPVTEEITKEYTVCVPKYEDVVKKYTVTVPVWTEKECKYTVNVPIQEERKGVRKVSRCVPVKETRTVCKDKGHWEERCVETCNSCDSCGGCNQDACDSCDSCQSCCDCDPCGGGLLARLRARLRARRCCEAPSTCKVWVPNIVKEEIEVTVMKRETVEQPYTYTVTVCKPEIRTKKVKECSYKNETHTKTFKVCKMVSETRTKKCHVTKYVKEERSKEVEYTVCEPVTKTKKKTVTTYKCVPEKVEQEYTVLVPVTYEDEVDVCVCKMVPKKVQSCTSCCPSTCCGSCK